LVAAPACSLEDHPDHWVLMGKNPQPEFVDNRNNPVHKMVKILFRVKLCAEGPGRAKGRQAV
jgi:hypothetical protein